MESWMIAVAVYLVMSMVGSYTLMKFFAWCGNEGEDLDGEDLFMIYIMMPLFWFVFLPITILVWIARFIQFRREASGKLSLGRRIYNKVTRQK